MYKLATIPLAEAHPSPTNPRKTFAEVPLRELADSIVVKGILQPLIARPLKSGGYEIVAGERRRRAARIAKLKEIPVSIGELTDLEVLEIQIIENSQRLDVTPLEEADGFLALQKKGLTAEQIAAKIGKSTSHVYGRLRLCSLGEGARAALAEGKIDVAVALIIARIHNAKLQDAAVEELLNQYVDGFIRPEDAREVVRDYMLVLADAPFDVKDARLVPAAGACEACPKRTGAQRELFGDEGKADHCLDRDCYQGKADAHWKVTAAKAEEGGARVLSDAETKKVFPYNGGQVSYSSTYVKLSDTCHEDPKRRSYKQLLGAKAKDSAVLARDPSGGVHELVKKDAAIALLKTQNKDVAKELERDQRSDNREAARRREQVKEQEQRRKVTTAILTAVVQKVSALETKLPDAAWRALGAAVVDHAHADTHAFVSKRRGLKTGAGNGAARVNKTLEKHLEELPITKVPALIFEVVLTQGAYFSWSDKVAPELTEAAKALGVDVAGLKKQLAAEAKAAAKAKSSPPKKPKPPRKK